MLSRDHTLAMALLVSAALHVGLLLVIAGRDPPDRLSSMARSPQARTLTIDRPTSPPPAELRFGDSIGGGNAANRAPGIDPIRAMTSDAAQAWLSRDPRGPGKVGDEPSMSVLPRGGMPAAEAPDPMNATKAIGLPQTQGDWASAPRISQALAKPKPSSAKAQARQSQTAGAPAPPADPAIQSESESDPFSVSASTIDFNDGRVDARFGRKVRMVRPNLSLAAKIDLSSMLSPQMTVRLRIDASGNVRKVDIVKSSGSDSADQAVRLALYQWWIEPRKDKSGQPVEDLVEFTINWR